MVAEVSDEHESEWRAMGEVARLLGSARLRRCATGCVRPRLMPGHALELRRRSPLS